VFSAWSLPRCYKQDNLKRVSCWWELSEVQFSEAMWVVVGEWVHLSIVSWKSAVKRRIGGWCEMVASLGPSQLRRVLYERLWRKWLVVRAQSCREDSMCVTQWDCYSSCVKIRCLDMASGDCNRLKTLVRLCQWSAKCNYESCVNVGNKSDIQSQPRLQSPLNRDNNIYICTYTCVERTRTCTT
jgi:hypothetical protein